MRRRCCPWRRRGETGVVGALEPALCVCVCVCLCVCVCVCLCLCLCVCSLLHLTGTYPNTPGQRRCYVSMCMFLSCQCVCVCVCVCPCREEGFPLFLLFTRHIPLPSLLNCQRESASTHTLFSFTHTHFLHTLTTAALSRVILS